jgi:hypothetical protein
MPDLSASESSLGWALSMGAQLSQRRLRDIKACIKCPGRHQLRFTLIRFIPLSYPSPSSSLLFTMSQEQIPKTQTAAVIESIGADLEIRTSHPVRQPDELQPGECLIKIEVSGVCHTDLHASKADWPILPTMPLVGGHEGVGHIVAIGKNTTHTTVKIGDRVGVKWLADSCLQCEACRKGLEQCVCLHPIHSFSIFTDCGIGAVQVARTRSSAVILLMAPSLNTWYVPVIHISSLPPHLATFSRCLLSRTLRRFLRQLIANLLLLYFVL